MSFISLPIITDLDFAYVERKSIAVDKEGTIYCCFLGSSAGSLKRLYVYQSRDKGASWENMNFPYNAAYLDQSAYTIGVDSSKTLHLVWIEPEVNQVIYASNIAGYWGNKTILSTASAAHLYPNLTIDTNDTVHVVWYARYLVDYDYTQIHYIKRNSNGSWSNLQMIPRVLDGYQYYPNITAIDSTCYVVWHGAKTAGSKNQVKLVSSSNSGTSWGSETLLEEYLGVAQTNASIDGDMINKKIFIAWEEEGRIKFSANRSSAIQLTSGSLYSESLNKVIVGNTDAERYVFHISSADAGKTLRYYTIINNRVSQSSIGDIENITAVTGIGGIYANGVYVISSIKSGDKYKVILTLSSSIITPKPEVKTTKYLFKDKEGYKKYADNCWTMIGTEPLTSAQIQTEGMVSMPDIVAIKSLVNPELYAYVVDTKTIQLKTTFTATETMIVATNNIPLNGVELIRKIVITATGNIKIIMSNDSGLTWYGLPSQSVDITDVASIKEKGLTAKQLTTLTETEWTHFRGKEKTLRFAYLFSPMTAYEHCSVDQLEIITDRYGDWHKAVHMTDYEYEYFGNNQLKVILKNNLNYKMNYLGKE